MSFTGNDSSASSNSNWSSDSTFGVDVGELEETSSAEASCGHGEPFPVSKCVDGWDSAGAGTTLVTVPLGFLLVVLVIATVAGNLLVCVTITTVRKLRTATNYFLLSLAVADLMLGVVVLPISTFTTLKAGHRWPFGSTFCNLYIASDVTLCTASILVLFSISVDRYLAIRFPLRYQQTVGRRLVWKINAGLWAFSALVGFVPIHLGWNTVDGRVQNVIRPDHCDFELNAGYALLIGLGTYFAPLVVMCTVYLKIFQISRRQVKAIQRMGFVGNHVSMPKVEIASIDDQFREGSDTINAVNTFQNTAANGSSVDVMTTPNAQTLDAAIIRASSEGTNSALSRKKLQNKVVTDRKALVTLTSVVVAFAACWIPYFALFVAKPFLSGPVDSRIELLVLWLGYANSSVNPFLYAFHSTSFRDGFRRVLCRRCRRRQSPMTDAPSMPRSYCCCCCSGPSWTSSGIGRSRRRSTACQGSRSKSPSAGVDEKMAAVGDGRQSRTCQQLLVAVTGSTSPDAEYNFADVVCQQDPLERR